jgi:endonuclease YncB( thermonuclease family)
MNPNGNPNMNQEPSDKYQIAFNDICQIYESTVLQAERRHIHERADSHYRMGVRIAAILDPMEQDGRYGRRLIPELCKQLKQKYPEAPGTRVIQYMRKFPRVYRPDQIHPELSWSHYCVLLSIEDDQLRRTIEQQAIDEKLTRSALRQLASMVSQNRSSRQPFPLTPRAGRINVARIVFTGASDSPVLDVGFGVEVSPSGAALRKLKQLPPGAFVQRTSDNRFHPITCEPGERYCYRGTPVDIIDGDTVKFRLTLTPDISIVERLRLRGIDAMEIDTKEGQRAKRALQRMLKDQTQLTVYTYHHDRYGRYIADLITKDGTYINRQLVEKGHARFLKM